MIPEPAKSITLEFDHLKEKGLYLIFPDSTCLKLTKENIESRCAALLADETKIPANVKKAKEFELCSICPKRGTSDTCHAIRPVLAYWENVDKYFSYDLVTAVYRGEDPEMIQVSQTSMQRALQYLSILSLMHYCETGKKYWKYFAGVTPLTDIHEIVNRLYLNILYYCRGDKAQAQKVIEKFRDEIGVTSRCQMDRVRLICKHDAFLNALVLTQITSEILAMDIEKKVSKSFEEFERKGSLS